MMIPTQKPQRVEFLVDSEDGAWLTIPQDRPWWPFWWLRRATYHFDKFGLIWLYQAAIKLMRRRVVDQGFDELQSDLRASLLACGAGGTLLIVYDEVLEQVAGLMREKGWVKA